MSNDTYMIRTKAVLERESRSIRMVIRSIRPQKTALFDKQTAYA